MEIDEKTIRKFFVVSIVLILIILSFLILKPILISILMGFVLSFIFYPLYKKIFLLTKSKNFSSLLVCFIFLIIIIIPLYFMFPVAIKQIFEMYNSLQSFDILGVLQKLFPSIFLSPEISASFSSSLSNLINTVITTILKGFTDYLIGSPTIILNMVIFLFVFFSTLKNGEELVNYIKEISPFSPAYEDRIFNRFKETTNALIFGEIIAGVIQGLSTGLALFILGIPNVIVLTLLAIFLSMFPVIGAYLIWIPAAIYLYVHGNVASAIILTIYGLTVISWIDNFVRAFIISKKTKINSGVLFVSMIGGLIVFGFFGIIIGPLVISYLLLALELYKENKLIEKS